MTEGTIGNAQGPTLERLMDALKDVIETDLKEYLLPVKQEGWSDQLLERPMEVWEMVMPEPDEGHERIPYILLQLLNGKDERKDDGRTECVVNVRIVITVYDREGVDGRLRVMRIIQRIRDILWKAGTIGKIFELQELEFLIYPDETEWYHLGEMVTTWKVPEIQRDLSEVWADKAW